MRLAIVQTTDGDSLQEIPLLLCVGVRPVPPLMMNTLGNPHHSLLLGNPHHGLLGNLHHTWGIPVILGNPQHSLLGNLHHGLLLGNPRHGLLANPLHPGESPSRSSPAPVRAMVDFILQNFLIIMLLPIHRRDHSISTSMDVAEAIPRQERFAVIFRMGRFATPFSILSTSLKGSQIRPLRGRNWR